MTFSLVFVREYVFLIKAASTLTLGQGSQYHAVRVYSVDYSRSNVVDYDGDFETMVTAQDVL